MDNLVFTAPKNFKKGRLILGRYRVIDLTILISSILFTVLSTIIYVTYVKDFHPLILVGLVLPSAIAYALTFPCGVYHNYIIRLKNIFWFYRKNQKYIWEGIYQHDEEY